MDHLNRHRQVIQQLIARHAQYKPSHGCIETVPMCDPTSDNYLLMDIGWDNTGRVHAVVFHLRLRDGKIWIEWDGTEYGIAQELVDAGIPKTEIVLAFYRPERRALTEFAVA